MKLYNFRLGFATNSSSSHSVVLAPIGAPVPVTNRMGQEGLMFGWDNFILADPQSKSEYFAAQLFMAMTGNDIPEGIAAATINSWFGVDVEENGGGYLDNPLGSSYDIHVDHQSYIALPYKVPRQFMKQFKEFISNDRVVIYGGNDNDGRMDIPSEYGPIGFLTKLTDTRGDILAKNDGKFWSIYNRNTGTKVRMSFDLDDMEATGYEKASAPELVDVKITDHCRYQCGFCYQSSTKNGSHADIKDINSVLYALRALGVFEIAIGGGEPTTHPKFSEILAVADELNITPNFTTFGVDWLRNKNIVDAVKKYVGGIGVSVHNAKALSKVAKIAKVINGDENNCGGYYYDDLTHIMAQHVIGTQPLDVTIDFIRQAWEGHIPVLLLGFKDVGFGFNYKRNKCEGLLLALKMLVDKSHHYRSLSVDTAFIQQFPGLAEILDVQEVLMTKEEGKFSMYIDVVASKMASSSYVNPSEYVDLDYRDYPLAQHIATAFSKW